MEVTMDSPAVLDVISRTKERYGHQLTVGAGTVLDPESANLAIQAGADFIFSPILDIDTIKLTSSYGRVSIPGVFTPTEMQQAIKAGADIVKVFPASVLGPRFFKDTGAALGHIPMMPTGGIGLDNVSDYIKAGAVAVGVGGSLLVKEWIEEENWDKLTDHARAFRSLVGG